MLERIVLAAIVTFCVYLFINLGEKSSQPAFVGGRLTRTTDLLNSIPLLSK